MEINVICLVSLIGFRESKIELYKVDFVHALYSIKISRDKRIMSLAILRLSRIISFSFNLGSHNVLLEATYDL